MTNLDSDVRNLLNHLYFNVSASWKDMFEFLWSPDTETDADLWVEAKPGTDQVQLKREVREFVITTDEQMKRLPTSDFVFGYPIQVEPRKKGERRPCFLALPTRAWLPDVKDAIERAAQGFECILSVDNAAPGDIMECVWQDIRRSEAIVADLTGENANVFYELGLAHALGKPVILIKQKEAPAVPFDISNHKFFEYDLAGLAELEVWLKSAFESLPKRYRFDASSSG